MGISEIYIVKRDGKRAPFSLEKIKRAISKAFLSVGGYATDDDLTSVLSRVHISDGMNVEEIQNQVEVALMAERYFAVAKSYMLYRQKHTEDREDREKLEFLINYCDASNPATGSKYDANANVENKNIATLIGELPKQNFIRLNRRLLTDRIKEMYGKELSDEEKGKIDEAIKEAEEAIRGNDIDAIKAKSEALGTAAQKLGEKMYAKQQAEAGAQQAGPEAAQGGGEKTVDGDVVDAEYTEVKDKK